MLDLSLSDFPQQTHDKLRYVAGLYYFEEEGTQAEEQFVDRALAEEVGIQVLDLVTGKHAAKSKQGRIPKQPSFLKARKEEDFTPSTRRRPDWLGSSGVV